MIEITEKECKIVEEKIKQFLWGTKRAKVALDTLQSDFKDGGLHLVNIRNKQKALRIAWIGRLEKCDLLLKSQAYEFLGDLGEEIWNCNLSHNDVIVQYGYENFWAKILVNWCEINFWELQTKAQVMDQIIWRNSHIKINNRTVMWPHWLQKGIMYVRNIVDEDGNMKTNLNVN